MRIYYFSNSGLSENIEQYYRSFQKRKVTFTTGEQYHFDTALLFDDDWLKLEEAEQIAENDALRFESLVRIIVIRNLYKEHEVVVYKAFVKTDVIHIVYATMGSNKSQLLNVDILKITKSYLLTILADDDKITQELIAQKAYYSDIPTKVGATIYGDVDTKDVKARRKLKIILDGYCPVATVTNKPISQNIVPDGLEQTLGHIKITLNNLEQILFGRCDYNKNECTDVTHAAERLRQIIAQALATKSGLFNSNNRAQRALQLVNNTPALKFYVRYGLQRSGTDPLKPLDLTQYSNTIFNTNYKDVLIRFLDIISGSTSSVCNKLDNMKLWGKTTPTKNQEFDKLKAMIEHDGGIDNEPIAIVYLRHIISNTLQVRLRNKNTDSGTKALELVNKYDFLNVLVQKGLGRSGNASQLTYPELQSFAKNDSIVTKPAISASSIRSVAAISTMTSATANLQKSSISSGYELSDYLTSYVFTRIVTPTTTPVNSQTTSPVSSPLGVSRASDTEDEPTPLSPYERQYSTTYTLACRQFVPLKNPQRKTDYAAANSFIIILSNTSFKESTQNLYSAISKLDSNPKTREFIDADIFPLTIDNYDGSLEPTSGAAATVAHKLSVGFTIYTGLIGLQKIANAPAKRYFKDFVDKITAEHSTVKKLSSDAATKLLYTLDENDWSEKRVQAKLNAIVEYLANRANYKNRLRTVRNLYQVFIKAFYAFSYPYVEYASIPPEKRSDHSRIFYLMKGWEFFGHNQKALSRPASLRLDIDALSDTDDIDGISDAEPFVVYPQGDTSDSATTSRSPSPDTTNGFSSNSGSPLNTPPGTPPNTTPPLTPPGSLRSIGAQSPLPEDVTSAIRAELTKIADRYQAQAKKLSESTIDFKLKTARLELLGAFESSCKENPRYCSIAALQQLKRDNIARTNKINRPLWRIQWRGPGEIDSYLGTEISKLMKQNGSSIIGKVGPYTDSHIAMVTRA